jgi:hypothetical protein
MNTLLRRLNHLRPTRFAGVAEVLVLLVPALLLWWLAYQAPAPLTLHIGGDVERFRREDDASFLTGVNASEPDSDTTWRWWELLTDGYPYRWTNAETQVDYPGAGGRRWLVEILARGGRPDGAPTTGTWQAGDTTLELQLIPGPPRRYRLLADSNAAGDLMLRLDSEAFSPPGDPRELGFVLHEIRFLPTRTGNNAAVAQLGWLALIVAIAYLSARRLTARTTALIFATGLVIAATYSLTWYRPALTIFSPVLALLTLSSAGLALAVDVGLRAAGVQGYRPILALITLGFVLRMAGMVHPHALFSDATFNANNLLRVALGQIQLSAGLPSEAGGGSAPYPPGLYVLLLPAQLLSGSDTVPRRLLVQAGTALLDSGVIGLIWLTLSRAGLGQPAALFGAACYLLPIPALESFSIGEYANLGGQALALPAVALLALGAANRKHWRQTALLSTALAIGLLGHSGVTLSLGALAASVWMLALLQRGRGMIDPWRLAIAGAVAISVALISFYSAPDYVAGYLTRAGGVTNDTSGGMEPLLIVRNTVLEAIGLGRPGGRTPLPIGLSLSAIAGLFWLQRYGPNQANGLRTVLIAWWIGVLLSQGLLLIADQGLRWALFLYPGLCLSAGIFLGAAWKRGWIGQLAAGIILATILGAGLITQIVQVRDYFHI